MCFSLSLSLTLNARHPSALPWGREPRRPSSCQTRPPSRVVGAPLWCPHGRGHLVTFLTCPRCQMLCHLTDKWGVHRQKPEAQAQWPSRGRRPPVRSPRVTVRLEAKHGQHPGHHRVKGEETGVYCRGGCRTRPLGGNSRCVSGAAWATGSEVEIVKVSGRRVPSCSLGEETARDEVSKLHRRATFVGQPGESSEVSPNT